MRGRSLQWKSQRTLNCGSIWIDLAIQNGNKDDIEKYIKEIGAIEGDEGLQSRYCQLRYLIWQAERTEDKETRLAIQLKAHSALEDLESRRGDWSLVPLAAAQLAETELAQGNRLSEGEIRAKEESIINYLSSGDRSGAASCRGCAPDRSTSFQERTGQ